MATVAAREREERNKEEFKAWQLSLLRSRDFDEVLGLLKERKLILELPDPDFAWTPLLFAADGGCLQLMSSLLDCRAKMEAVDEECNTPLCVAARQGHVGAVQLLAARKANIDAQNRGGWTPLAWAAMNGHDGATAALLDLNASFYVVDALGRTALMWAARHGHTTVAETLLARGVDFTRRDEDGLNAADHAQEHFELRASIVLAEERSRRLLEAAQRNDVDAVRQAIEAGAGVDIPDETGWSPLAWAMLLESRPLVEVLVQHGANPYLLGEEASMGEQLAAKHTQVAEVLKEVLNANDVLLRAARVGWYKCAGRQLLLGAWVNVLDEEERTPLMWAAKRGSVRGTNLFVSKGAVVNAKDRIGFTAFLYSVLAGNVEVTSTLHHHKADIHARSYYGHSAIHLAVKAEDAQMVQLLIAAGLDANEKDQRSRAPLHNAAANGQLEVLKTLAFCMADLHTRDEELRTPLFLAVAEEQFTVCQALLGAVPLEPPEPTPAPQSESEDEEEEEPPQPEDSASSEDEYTSGSGSESSGGERGGVSRFGSVASPVGGSMLSRHGLTKADADRNPMSPSVSGMASDRSRMLAKAGSTSSIRSRKGRRPSALEALAALQEEDRPRRASKAPEPPPEEPYDAEEAERKRAAEAAEEERRKRLANSKLRKVAVLVKTATRMKVTTKNAAKEKLDPATKRRHELLARFQEPLGLVKAAAEWRREHLESEKPPRMPDAEELFMDEDDTGCRPLQLAARVPSKSICELLVSVSAEVRLLDKNKTNALIEASRSGDAEVVEVLLEKKADVNHRNNDGHRPVDVAANVEVREILEKAMVARRVPHKFGGKPEAPKEAAAAEEAVSKPAIFRVRLERLPRKIEGELLRRHIRRLLRELGAGRPLSLEVLLDPITERPRGVAFADFSEEKAAEAALTGNGEEFLDHEIAIVRDLPMAMVR